MVRTNKGHLFSSKIYQLSLNSADCPLLVPTQFFLAKNMLCIKMPQIRIYFFNIQDKRKQIIIVQFFGLLLKYFFLISPNSDSRVGSRGRRRPKKVGCRLRSVTQKRNQGHFPVMKFFVDCGQCDILLYI